MLGFTLHRAGRDLPPAERRRPPYGPHGRRRPTDALPARVRRALHCRPRHVQSKGLRGRSDLGPRRSTGRRPGERRRLPGARRRDRRQDGRHQGASTWSVTGRRNRGRADRTGAAAAAGADRRAGRAARAAGRAARGALRLPPGHRMVPGRRRLPHRPEPTDHDAVPDPRGRRRRQPRLRVGRSPADDDGPHEAPRALRVAADRPPADAHGRRAAVRRRHRRPGVTRRIAPASSRPWDGATPCSATRCRPSSIATSSRRARTRLPARQSSALRRARSTPIPPSSPS